MGAGVGVGVGAGVGVGVEDTGVPLPDFGVVGELVTGFVVPVVTTEVVGEVTVVAGVSVVGEYDTGTLDAFSRYTKVPTIITRITPAITDMVLFFISPFYHATKPVYLHTVN